MSMENPLNRLTGQSEVVKEPHRRWWALGALAASGAATAAGVFFAMRRQRRMTDALLTAADYSNEHDGGVNLTARSHTAAKSTVREGASLSLVVESSSESSDGGQNAQPADAWEQLPQEPGHPEPTEL